MTTDEHPWLRVAAAGPHDVPEVAALLSAAFADDPVMTAFLGPGRDRERRLAGLYGAVLRSGPLASGAVDVVRDGSGRLLGAAVWEAPGRAMKLRDQLRQLPAFWRSVGPTGIVRALGNERVLGRYRPRPPHWYLMTIGVAPAARGLGAGSNLLRHRLSRIDAEGCPAYLEGSAPRNQALYARWGFVRLGTIEGLPAGAAPVGMWRPAAAPGVGA
ncbi:GNAT family N-acetyltransferase [Kineococcus gynurae]|uniref:GNAT family N-acetyltransferase n=1 Tax=Kineococcus gynurae TaxID=452979 RepID=A0ABV5LXE7_9ACTN